MTPLRNVTLETSWNNKLNKLLNFITVTIYFMSGIIIVIFNYFIFSYAFVTYHIKTAKHNVFFLWASVL